MKQFPLFSQQFERSCQTSIEPIIIEFYTEKLPPDIITDWKEAGWCSYGKGFLWTVNPAWYWTFIEDVFQGSTHQNYVFMRTAFGNLFAWNGEEMRYIDIVSQEIIQLPRRLNILFDGLLCDEDYLDEVFHWQLFKQALQTLGTLQAHECYALKLPLALGGSLTLNNLHKADWEVYLNWIHKL